MLEGKDHCKCYSAIFLFLQFLYPEGSRRKKRERDRCPWKNKAALQWHLPIALIQTFVDFSSSVTLSTKVINYLL
jgi:CRISPR/Cas system-associated endonuclease Cas1